MIIPTGMASVAKFHDVVSAAQHSGCNDLILLRCTSTYPLPPRNTNILTVPYLRTQFGVEDCLSDHTMGIGVSVASVAFGSTVIKKHFNLNRSDGDVESSFSMQPNEISQLVTETECAWQSLDQIIYYAIAEEINRSRLGDFCTLLKI